jgi:hypothetical protein
MWQQEICTEFSVGTLKSRRKQGKELKQISDVETCITDVKALGTLNGSV